MKMYCPADGKEMKWQGPDADTFACPTCGMVLAYRSCPQRFDVLRDSGIATGEGEYVRNYPKS